MAAARLKLERSIASNKFLKAGSVVQESDIHLLSPGNGFQWIQKDLVLGKVIKSDLAANEIILPENLK